VSQNDVSLETDRAVTRRAVLVVNTRVRRGERWYPEAKRRIVEAGITLDASYPVRYAERIQDIVQGAINEGHKFIIIGGGDGTISAVVDHFAYGDVVFGLLPLGTANSFSRTLGIPVDLAGAVDVLINGRVSNVDLGKINEDYFANGASIGLPAAVGRAAPPRLKRWFGRSGYLFVAAYKFTSHQPFECILTIDGRKKSIRAFDIRIASGGYQGGILVASDARPNDGKILIHVLRGPSKWAIAKEWGKASLGLPFGPSDVEVVKVPELEIDTVPKQDVAIDGEVLTQTPIRVSIARNALQIMAPKSYCPAP